MRGRGLMKINKLLSIFLTVMIILSICVPVYADNEMSFFDIQGHWAEKIIKDKAERRFIKGYHDGTFRPDNDLTIAELITMVNRMLGLTKTKNNDYTDLKGDEWYNSEADKAAYYQYWQKTDFNGNNLAARLDILKILDSLLQVPATDKISPFKDLEGLNEEGLDLVNHFYAAGYIRGDGQGNSMIFDILTRAEMLTFFENCLGYIVRTQEDVKDIPKGGRVTIIGQNIILDGVEIDELIISPGVHTNVTIKNSEINNLIVLAESTDDIQTNILLTNTNVGGTQNPKGIKIEKKIMENKSSNRRKSTKDAEVPSIATDLTNHSVSLNSTLTLDATATVSDGGTITYQWYSADDASKTNSQTRTGGAIYTVDTTNIGTYYYYCTVTNTNTAVNGDTTKSVDTSVSTVMVVPNMTGEGTQENPFIITSIEDLCLIGTGSNADGNDYGLNKSYRLGRSLDFADPESYKDASGNMDSLSGWDYVNESTIATTTAGGINTEGFLPIGSYDNKFTGTFNGGSFTISNLYINRTSNHIGLFGFVFENAVLSDIGLIDMNVSGGQYVGGLVGYIAEYSTVSNSYTTGNVSGGQYIGGLVGYSYHGIVSNSYTTGNVSDGQYVGGLVGMNRSSQISNSYATGDVNGNDYVGGLVGENDFGKVSNSYATGDVSGDVAVGGLVGFNSKSEICNSIAFNSAISGVSNTNRIVGSHYGLTADNNYANRAMTVNGVTTSGITTDVNGADISDMIDTSSQPLSTWEFDTDTNGDHAYWVLIPGTNRPVLYTDADGDGTFTKLGSDDGMFA